MRLNGDSDSTYSMWCDGKLKYRIQIKQICACKTFTLGILNIAHQVNVVITGEVEQKLSELMGFCLLGLYHVNTWMLLRYRRYVSSCAVKGCKAVKVRNSCNWSYFPPKKLASSHVLAVENKLAGIFSNGIKMSVKNIYRILFLVLTTASVTNSIAQDFFCSDVTKHEAYS